jgi:Asp/Glu/hydantoin racemase
MLDHAGIDKQGGDNMRILILNPNTTEAVTSLMATAGQAVAAAGTELVPMTAPRGFPYISSRAEAQIGGAVALEMLADAHRSVDGAILAAFGDPGLLGARELFDIPIVGVSEAAMLTACMLGRRFLIVTFARALGSWYRDCVEMHGLDSRCAGISALDKAFSSIEDVQNENLDPLVELANRDVEEMDADVMIFAGAPLSGLSNKVRDRIPVPIVDPIAAAVKQAEALVALRPRKAVAGSSRRAAAKPSIGLPPSLATRIERSDP